MPHFYSYLICFYSLLMHFAALFNKKAAHWINVRRNWLGDLRQKIDKNQVYCWIHCASAGEFEQAIPIIKELRIKNGELQIAVSFYSSSGYDLYKNSDLADIFFYFPLDTRQNAAQLIEILKPRFAIFIRNEIWWNTLSVLKGKYIPIFLVNANLGQKRNFFYQKYLDHAYPLFTKVFEAAFGNTKSERVCELKNEPFPDKVMENFRKNSFVAILGSSWKEEEKIMADFYKRNKLKYPNLKIIIAPHEFDPAKQNELENLFNEKVITYSQYELGITNCPILFLDKKGILKYAYRYTDLAFIGGGFNKSVHNISEAAVYGIPTLFGPNYEKFGEIKEMVVLQAVFPVLNYLEFEQYFIQLMVNVELQNDIKKRLDNYFDSQKISSQKIVAEILK